MIKTLLVLMLAVTASCGFDGGYRYPCQDPANWNKPECIPPLCEADGTCSRDLLPEEVFNDN